MGPEAVPHHPAGMKTRHLRHQHSGRSTRWYRDRALHEWIGFGRRNGVALASRTSSVALDRGEGLLVGTRQLLARTLHCRLRSTGRETRAEVGGDSLELGAE